MSNNNNIYNNHTHTLTATSMYGNTVVEDTLSEAMKKQVDESIVRVLKLNAMSDEEIIEQIMREPDVFELLTAPSDDVKRAHLYRTEL